MQNNIHWLANQLGNCPRHWFWRGVLIVWLVVIACVVRACS